MQVVSYCSWSITHKWAKRHACRWAAQGVTDGGSRRLCLYDSNTPLNSRMEAYGRGGAFNSRTSLPRQYVSGKHFALNPCFPRPTANLLLPRKPPRSCEQKRDDDRFTHTERLCAPESSHHQTLWKPRLWGEVCQGDGAGMESGLCSEICSQPTSQISWQSGCGLGVGPEKIRLCRGHLSPFARAFVLMGVLHWKLFILFSAQGKPLHCDIREETLRKAIQPSAYLLMFFPITTLN